MWLSSLLKMAAKMAVQRAAKAAVPGAMRRKRRRRALRQSGGPGADGGYERALKRKWRDVGGRRAIQGAYGALVQLIIGLTVVSKARAIAAPNWRSASGMLSITWRASGL